jgi:WD40 repeat protein
MEEEVQDGSRYWAFISYSRHDAAWAHWLHRAIERYGVPAHLVNHPTPAGHLSPRRFHPVFRDRDELPASSDLGAAINAALQDSRYLIVICSPAASKSRWVNEEIERFLKLGRKGRILALIVDGEPGGGDERECFPPALRSQEPVAADVREIGDGRSNARLKLIAGMLGVTFDALAQRDRQRRRRRVLTASVGGVLCLLGLGSLLRYASEQTREAITARETSNKAERFRDLASSRYHLERALAVIETSGRVTDEAAVLLLESYRQKRTYVSGLLLAHWIDRTAPIVRLLRGNRFPVLHLEFAPEGKRILKTDTEGVSRLIGLGNGEVIQSIGYGQVPRDRLSARFLPEGPYIVTVADTGQVQFWDTTNGSEVGNTPNAKWGEESSELSPHGERLAIINGEGSLRILDPLRNVTLVSMRVPRAPSYTLLWDDKGSRLLVSGSETYWQLLDAASGAILLAPPTGRDGRYIAISPNGDMVFEGDSESSSARVWSVNAGQRLVTLGTKRLYVNQAVFSSDGSRVAVLGADGISVWDSQTGRRCFEISNDRLSQKRSWGLGGVSFNPSGDRLAVRIVGASPRVLLLDAETGALAAEFEATVSGERTDIPVAFPPAGSLIAAASGRGDIELREIMSVGAETSFVGHVGPVGALASSDDARIAATGGDDDTIRIWDLLSGAALATLTGHGDDLQSIAVSHDGARVLSVAKDGTARIWHSKDGKELGQLGDTSFIPDRAVLSKGGSRVAIAGGSVAQIRSVGKIETGVSLVGHTSRIRDLEFDGTAARLITTSDDHTARVWNAHDGAQVAVLLGHRGAVMKGRFARGGDRAITAGADNTVRLWETASGREVATLDPLGQTKMSADLAPRMDLLGRDELIVTDGPYPAQVKIWSPVTGQLLRTLETPQENSQALAAARSADLLAFATYSTLQIWNGRTGIRVCEVPQTQVASLRLSEDGKLLLVRESEGAISLWSTENCSRIGRDEPPASRTISIQPDGSFSIPRGGPYVEAAFRDSRGTILALSDSSVIESFSSTFMRSDKAIPLNPRRWISLHDLTTVRLDPEGARLAVVEGSHRVAVSEVNTGRAIFELPAVPIVRGMALHPDGSQAVTLPAILGSVCYMNSMSECRGNEFSIWNATTRTRVSDLSSSSTRGGRIEWVAYSASGRLVIVGGYDQVEIWDSSELRQLLTVPGLASIAGRVLHSHKDRLLVVTVGNSAATNVAVGPGPPNAEADTDSDVPDMRSGPIGVGQSSAVAVWDLTTQKRILSIGPIGGTVVRASFARSGSRILTITSDGVVQLWNGKTSRELGRWERKALAEPVRKVELVRGVLIATGAGDSAIELIDARSGRSLHRLLGHDGEVLNMEYNPASKRLATSSSDSTGRSWALRFERRAPAAVAKDVECRTMLRLQQNNLERVSALPPFCAK